LVRSKWRALAFRSQGSEGPIEALEGYKFLGTKKIHNTQLG